MATAGEIEANRSKLSRIVAGLLALVGMTAEYVPATVTRALHLVVLSTLLPAEAATRRLVEILALDVVVAPSAPTPPSEPIPRGKRGAKRSGSFPLFDPRKYPKPEEPPKARGPGPQAGVVGLDPHVAYAPPVPSPEDEVEADALCRRLDALARALADLPKQARRLARTYARGKAKWLRVMRPGRPPGHRSRNRREVHEILADCHWFALEALRKKKKVPP